MTKEHEPISISRFARGKSGTWAMVLFVIGFVSFLLHLIYMVATGRGLETYRSANLIEWSYISALITFGIIGVMILVPVVLFLLPSSKTREHLEQLRKLDKQ